MTLFAAKRMVFLQAGKGPETKAEAPVEAGKEKPKSVEDSRAEAKIALEDARAEMANIEANFGKPGKKGELAKDAPPKIVEHYNTLKKIVADLSVASKHEQTLIEVTLLQFDQVMGELEEFARGPQGVPLGDPLAPLGYKPRRFDSRVSRMPEPKKPTEAQAGAEKPAESKEEKMDRVIAQIIEKAQTSEKVLTEEEGKVILARLKGNDVLFVDGQHGETYDIELSTDKKFVRVSGDLGPNPEKGLKSAKFTSVLKLDAKATAEPKFKLKTSEEIEAAKIEANKKDFSTQLAWLESESAPLGSIVIVTSSEITRKNPDTGATEKGYQSYAVKKGADGLHMVTLQYFVDESGKAVTPAMEVKRSKYNAEEVTAMVTANPVTTYEGTAADKKEELRRKIDDLLHDLVAYIPLGGISSPNFQGKLKEIKAFCDKFNVSKRTYHDTILGLIVKVDSGKVSFLDPSKKNPEYKSPEETPDVPKYAYGAGFEGPIDLGKYA